MSTKTKLKIWFYFCIAWFVVVLVWAGYCCAQGWWELLPLNIFSVAMSGWNLYMASDLL